jgi:hypothetical protein
VDLAAAIGMTFPGWLWPQRFAAPFQRGRAKLAYEMRAGAPLMAGWAVLLWADRRPMERQGVLPITVAPVLAGLLANDALAVRAKQVAPAGVLPTRVLQMALLVLFGWSYRYASRAQTRG